MDHRRQRQPERRDHRRAPRSLASPPRRRHHPHRDLRSTVRIALARHGRVRTLRRGDRAREPLLPQMREPSGCAVAGGRQQTAGSRQQAAGSRQRTAGSRQQTAGSRQRTAGSRQRTAVSKQQGGRFATPTRRCTSGFCARATSAAGIEKARLRVRDRLPHRIDLSSPCDSRCIALRPLREWLSSVALSVTRA